MEPGAPLREDYEYKRNGTCNLFLWVEPLAGRRGVQVTERRTSVDFAEQIRYLVDVAYPDVDRIVLVVDNLSTHHAGALYEAFPAEQAHRLASKIEWHYTPEHGSWLNMAEIELSVLSRQCLSAKMPDIDTVRQQSAAWVVGRDSQKATIDWQFTASDARTKLRRLYPSVRANHI